MLCVNRPLASPQMAFVVCLGPLGAPSSLRIPIQLNWIHVLSSPLSFFEPQMYRASASFVADWLERLRLAAARVPSRSLHKSVLHSLLSSATAIHSKTSETKNADLLYQPLKVLRA